MSEWWHLWMFNLCRSIALRFARKAEKHRAHLPPAPKPPAPPMMLRQPDDPGPDAEQMEFRLA